MDNVLLSNCVGAGDDFEFGNFRVGLCICIFGSPPHLWRLQFTIILDNFCVFGIPVQLFFLISYIILYRYVQQLFRNIHTWTRYLHI